MERQREIEPREGADVELAEERSKVKVEVQEDEMMMIFSL